MKLRAVEGRLTRHEAADQICTVNGNLEVSDKGGTADRDAEVVASLHTGVIFLKFDLVVDGKIADGHVNLLPAPEDAAFDGVHSTAIAEFWTLAEQFSTLAFTRRKVATRHVSAQSCQEFAFQGVLFFYTFLD